jgi:hypothetical protein
MIAIWVPRVALPAAKCDRHTVAPTKEWITMTRSVYQLVAVALFGIGTLAQATQGAGLDPKQIHPKVFQMIGCLISDNDEPVATEINLDAIRKDQNQFDPTEIKQVDGWTQCPDNRGFLRYRIVKSAGNRFTVEYQENGGGSLTTSSLIEFSIEVRPFNRDSKQASAHVLRVEGISSK